MPGWFGALLDTNWAPWHLKVRDSSGCMAATGGAQPPRSMTWWQVEIGSKVDHLWCQGLITRGWLCHDCMRSVATEGGGGQG